MKKTVLLFVLIANMHLVFGTTYYVSPTGNDGASGTSEGQALGTFNKAWEKLYPGDTLILLDGVYKQTLRPNKRNGEPGNPIIVCAKNEGKAILDGEDERITIKLGDTWPGPIGEWYVLEGIVARNSSGGVVEIRGNHNVLRRCCFHDANTDENAMVCLVWADSVLVEDCVGWGAGRKTFTSFKSTSVTFRRCFAAWGEWDGRIFCAADSWPQGQPFQIYHGTNCIIENCISYGMAPDYGISMQGNDPRAILVGCQILGCGMATTMPKRFTPGGRIPGPVPQNAKA